MPVDKNEIFQLSIEEKRLLAFELLYICNPILAGISIH